MKRHEKRLKRSVVVELLSKNNFPKEPQRQIENEILYVESGNASIFIGNSYFDVHAGDFLFINSFEEYYYIHDYPGNLLRCYRILFDSSAFGSTDDSCRLFFEGIKLCRFLKMPESLLQRIPAAAEMSTEDATNDFILRSVLFDILSYAVETHQYERFSLIQKTEKRSVSAIDNALQFIRDNYSENLSLGAILQLTNYSKSHFIRLFKENTGMNVSEYINKYRIEKACLDLLYSNSNITEIATANGFNNIQYFSRKFKEYMDCTPKQYQKKRRKLTERTVVD